MNVIWLFIVVVEYLYFIPAPYLSILKSKQGPIKSY